MSPRRPSSQWITALLLLALFGAAVGGAAVRAAPAVKQASQFVDHIVISEFRSRGLNGGDDEFVELYNPTGAAINIGGWMVLTSSSCGSDSFLLFTIESGTVLQAGQHFLAASSPGSSLGSADQTFPPAIADEGGIALVDENLEPIDQAGMCTGTRHLEGEPLPPLSGMSDQSYERLPGGDTACTDTEDNRADFHLISPSNPQGLAAPKVICAGVKTVTPTATATFTPTAIFTATNTPIPAAHVVISEFRTRGPKGASDEFVELYNPSGADINIGGWVIKRSSGCGSTINTLVTIDNNVILKAGQHYLLASNTNSSINGADKIFTPGIVNNGGIALFTLSGALVDQVGMCEDTEFVESPALAPLPSDTDQSYERNVGGDTSCHDTNKNAFDFHLLNPSNPQNSASPIVMCIGAVTATPSATPTRTATRTVTPTRSATAVPTAYPGAVVLNEFLPRPASDWNGDGKVNSRDEYIEIINMDTQAINLKGWKLADAPGGSSAFTLPDLTLQPRQVARFFALETGISLSDAGDTVRLIKPDGRTADLWNYPIVTAKDQTWCRLPDGSGAWGFVCLPTPGRPNARLGSEPGAPVERPTPPPPAASSDCLLPDTAPQAFWLGECNAPGGDIWNRFAGRELWLQNRWKWDVIVK